MSYQETRSTIVNDQAEGTSDMAGEQIMISMRRTSVAPAVHLAEDHGMPAAETGLQEAVKAEGRDNTDAQDASRTTAETSAYPAGKAPAQKSSAPSVLIVEDSAELAEIIQATLQRLDMVTAHETHGNKAFNRYHEFKPDVMLLDIGLPDMTGWKVLENIRERIGDGVMPKVIVITAYGDPANRLIGKLQNVHDYLIKPFTSDEVERVVLNALGSAGK